MGRPARSTVWRTTMSDALTRRDFLTWSGATVAGVTLGEWGRRALARADERRALRAAQT